MSRFTVTFFLASVVILIGHGAWAQTTPSGPTQEGSASPIQIDREITSSRELSLEVGQTRLMESSVQLGRVSVANPEVADLKVVTNRQLLLTAKSVGDTFLTLWDRTDKAIVLSLHVRRNLDAMRKQLKDLFPQEDIKVSAAGDLVVLTGEVSDVRLPERILSVARLHAPKVANLLHVKGNQQVQLEVKFAEVARTSWREMGFNFFAQGSTKMGGMVGPGQSITDFAGGSMTPVYHAPFSNSFNLFFSTLGRFPFSVAVSLLEQNALAKTLAEPTLVALSGQEAKFLAGGEFPIPVASTLGQVQIEFKKFGIQLKFAPTVLSDDLISLKMFAEVSEIDPANGITLSGITIPGLSTRQSETTVRLRDGQSFAVAGMLSDKVRSNVDKVPGLGELPILGALFRSQKFRRDETELMVVVTVHLVRPLGADQAPALPGQDQLNDPNDLQLFLLGQDHVAPKLPPARGEAIPVEGKRLGGPVGELGFIR